MLLNSCLRLHWRTGSSLQVSPVSSLHHKTTSILFPFLMSLTCPGATDPSPPHCNKGRDRTGSWGLLRKEICVSPREVTCLLKFRLIATTVTLWLHESSEHWGQCCYAISRRRNWRGKNCVSFVFNLYVSLKPFQSKRHYDVQRSGANFRMLKPLSYTYTV